MKTDKKEIEGKLIIDDLSENAHRVRRNLLIFSFVAIFYKLSGASISENGVSFYGINFQHIDENFISIGISLIVFYHLFHFLLIAIAHWQYLRIRVTKSDVKFLTAARFAAEAMIILQIQRILVYMHGMQKKYLNSMMSLINLIKKLMNF